MPQSYPHFYPEEFAKKSAQLQMLLFLPNFLKRQNKQ
jgi:hypothetical protein